MSDNDTCIIKIGNKTIKKTCIAAAIKKCISDSLLHKDVGDRIKVPFVQSNFTNFLYGCVINKYNLESGTLLEIDTDMIKSDFKYTPPYVWLSRSVYFTSGIISAKGIRDIGFVDTVPPELKCSNGNAMLENQCVL